MLLKRCLRPLVLLKGKLGQLPFAVTIEWSLNIVYGLYYGLFGLQHQQNESCNLDKRLKRMSSHLIRMNQKCFPSSCFTTFLECFLNCMYLMQSPAN